MYVVGKASLVGKLLTKRRGLTATKSDDEYATRLDVNIARQLRNAVNP